MLKPCEKKLFDEVKKDLGGPNAIRSYPGGKDHLKDEYIWGIMSEHANDRRVTLMAAYEDGKYYVDELVLDLMEIGM